jgi:uridylate kinase
LEIRAELILKGTKVSGIFDSNPEKNSSAKQFQRLVYDDYLKIPEATILDKTAVTMAEEHHLPIYVFKWENGALLKAVKLQAGGTLIS